MAAIKILQEHEIQVYSVPDKPTKQRVITYQVEGLAPRTLWLDSEKIPDAAFLLQNPGQKVPQKIQEAGDAVRKAAIEADVARIRQQTQARTI